SPKRPKTRSAPCPICEHMFYPGNSMSRHMNQKHDTQFNRPFNCPECDRQGLAKTIITDRETWMRHMEERHGRDGQTGTAVSQPDLRLNLKRKACDEIEGQISRGVGKIRDI
ncbi:hypothetical protein QBC38DRAFT_462593, partial [Podospora fimiseda]